MFSSGFILCLILKFQSCIESSCIYSPSTNNKGFLYFQIPDLFAVLPYPIHHLITLLLSWEKMTKIIFLGETAACIYLVPILKKFKFNKSKIFTVTRKNRRSLIS